MTLHCDGPLSLAVLALAGGALLACAHGAPGAKATRRGDDADTLFGVRVADPYRWLEDAKSPEVQAWMAAQDEAARAALGKLPGRDELHKRLAALAYLDVIGIPHVRGPNTFFSRREATREKSRILVRTGDAEKVLLDPYEFAADGTTSLGTWVPSDQGALVAYTLHENNSDEATLRVRDVATGKDLPDRIEGAKYASPSWTAEGDGFYYTWLPVDPSIPVGDRPGYQEVRFHKLGDAATADRVVRPALKDATKFQNAGLSRDGRWLVLSVADGWTKNDVWLRDAKSPDAQWVEVVVGRVAHFDVTAFQNKLYIVTDEGASRKKVMVADCSAPGHDQWRELIPEHATDTLDGLNVVGGKLGLTFLHDVTSRLEVRDLDGSKIRDQALPGLGTSSGFVGDEEQDDAYYTFTSLARPSEIFRAKISSGETASYFRVKAPVDPDQYELTQRFFTSKDGTRIPIFVGRKKGTPQDGSARAILTGYGGFDIAIQPTFSATAVTWMDQGGVWAIANLRGGAEYGEEWHRAGMLANKQNVFDDFAAAARFLAEEKFTARERLAVYGGSNGGLLVGAIETQHPDLMGAVICAVPLLDMVRYEKFGSGRTWASEYGSAGDEAQFKTLFAYSPYHHVVDGTRYPATLFLSADSDDRVDPMHARKMAAALQHASPGSEILLRIERHAGHGGADMIKQGIDQSADWLAFAMSVLR